MTGHSRRYYLNCDPAEASSVTCLTHCNAQQWTTEKKCNTLWIPVHRIALQYNTEEWTAIAAVYVKLCKVSRVLCRNAILLHCCNILLHCTPAVAPAMYYNKKSRGPNFVPRAFGTFGTLRLHHLLRLLHLLSSVNSSVGIITHQSHISQVG